MKILVFLIFYFLFNKNKKNYDSFDKYDEAVADSAFSQCIKRDITSVL